MLVKMRKNISIKLRVLAAKRNCKEISEKRNNHQEGKFSQVMPQIKKQCAKKSYMLSKRGKIC